MTLSFLRAAAVIGATAVPLLATGAPDPAKVAAGTYMIEPYHTRVMFGIDHMGFSTYYGQFVNASGSLKIDPKDPAAASLDVKVPTASVSTTNAKLDGELKSADWLDAEKYPEISFKSTKVTAAGGDAAEVTGDLTIHGVTKPVTLRVKLHGQGANPMSKKPTIGFDISGKIKRTDFGVSKYVPLIGDEVDLIISAALEMKS